VEKVDFPGGGLLSGQAIPGSAVISSIGGNAGARMEKFRRERRAAGVKKAAFKELLEDARESSEASLSLVPGENSLQQLLDEVHSAGDDLKKRQLPVNITRYRQAVRNFLHYVVENGYSVETQTGRMTRAGRKQYTLVQVVDRKLEELAAVILSGQAAQIGILARIDEINGLLVDILQ
jgi:uncharacterized protein YaaR (DUF327 family)